MQFVGQSHQVDGLLVLAQLDHVREDAAVLIEEKIFGAQRFNGGIQRVIVEDNGAENGAFRVEIIRQRLFEGGVGCHVFSPPDFAFCSPY